MFEERTVFYFNPFYFKDGNTASPKYFIVLKQLANQTIIVNLPSSQNYIPFPEENVKHGCIDLPDLEFCCYCFQKGIPVTDAGFSFALDTFLYGRWVDEHNIDILKKTYTIENIDYTIHGKLTPEIYQDVLECLKTSSQIKRKYKKLITEWLN